MADRSGIRRTEGSTSPLWFWPAVGAATAFVMALVLVAVPLPRSLAWLAWPGAAASARSLLQVVAASVMTVTALTFSVTVVALQLASQQFSPRLLRDFTRDRVIKAVLTVLIGTFVFATTVLRETSGVRLPNLALLAVSLLGLVALGAVLGFVTHIARVLRVDTMMRTVHEETERGIAAFYRRYDDPRPPPDDGLDRSAASCLCAARSGFVRVVNVTALMRAARRHDIVIAVDVRPGDHVVRGTPVALAWSRHGPRPDPPALYGDIGRGVAIGYERTSEQDVAFGFRQLTDIAVRAISPGINDPVTAVHAVGHMSDLLVTLAGRRLGPAVHVDADGVARVIVSGRDLRYYLDLVCGPIRRYGRDEPIVLVALLRLLRDLAASARDDDQRHVVERQTELVLAEVPESLGVDDARQVFDLAKRVRQALGGDVAAAYYDRSGETRSV